MTDSEQKGVQENQAGPSVTPEDTATTPPQAAEGTGAFSEPEKFKEKSRTDILKSYAELERRFHDQSEEKKQFEAFAQQVSPFFVSDPDTGRIDWNDEYGMKLAEARGWLKDAKPKEPEPLPPEQQQQQKDKFMQTFEDNPQETLKAQMRELMQEAMSEVVTPLRQKVNQQEQDHWIREMQRKYPDKNTGFEAYRTKMGELMNRYGFQVKSEQDLEKAYVATKAITGGMIDKHTAEEEIARRDNALSVFQGVSNTYPAVVDEMNAPEGDLIGLNRSVNKKQDVTNALFDKPTLDPLP